MKDRKTWFFHGVRDGIPIAVGYFAVAFALGIKADGAGFSALQAALLSLLNVTSAGEAAGIALIGAGTTYVELAFTQLVINIRYLLMSCALSQKLSPSTGFFHRMLIGYGVTDEIFGISAAVEGKLSPYYSYGAISVAVPGWTLGTLLGTVLGNVLPTRVTAALGVALYAMFLAIILPPARKSRVIAGLVAVSMAASGLLTLLCRYFALTWFTEGFRIIALTVTISFGAALLFPVKEQHEEVEV
ncbi:MAG: AzlC family ABC transporter permease [Ruminococcaceae bacterium]|nr:AzlC family ABC transporter permease [Oscillospiraceae bacterium]